MQALRPVLISAGIFLLALAVEDSLAERLAAEAPPYPGVIMPATDSTAGEASAQGADGGEERRRSEAAAGRADRAEQQAELLRQAIAREKSCVIKPAMTDAEIDNCKRVWSVPAPQ